MAIRNSITSNSTGLDGPEEPISESAFRTLPMIEFEASSSGSPESQPSSVETMSLWQYFIDRVNPLLKIVHIPSLEPYVLRAAVGMHLVPTEQQALLHSIFAMAVISMSDQECYDLLGYSRDTMLKAYGTHTKRALIKYNHMENYTMVTLQTLILYLVRTS